MVGARARRAGAGERGERQGQERAGHRRDRPRRPLFAYMKARSLNDFRISHFGLHVVDFVELDIFLCRVYAVKLKLSLHPGASPERLSRQGK